MKIIIFKNNFGCIKQNKDKYPKTIGTLLAPLFFSSIYIFNYFLPYLVIIYFFLYLLFFYFMMFKTYDFNLK